MSIELTNKYAPKADELFKAESKLSLLTNTDYDWTGAHTVTVMKISTAKMNDYKRNISEADDDTLSRFGKILDLDTQQEEMLLKRDRSFIFNIDKLDSDESNGQIAAGSALARQLREVVIPEVDSYVYQVMVDGAGTVADAEELTGANIYNAITRGTETLDDAEIPDTERVLVVTPAVYRALKFAELLNTNCDITAEQRLRGVIAMIDGMTVVKVPSVRLPADFGFMIAHPSATVAPVKLEDYGTHDNTPLSSGTIVTGRIAYDAFVLDNKKMGIYYQPILTEETE